MGTTLFEVFCWLVLQSDAFLPKLHWQSYKPCLCSTTFLLLTFGILWGTFPLLGASGLSSQLRLLLALVSCANAVALFVVSPSWCVTRHSALWPPQPWTSSVFLRLLFFWLRLSFCPGGIWGEGKGAHSWPAVFFRFLLTSNKCCKKYYESHSLFVSWILPSNRKY